MLSDYLQLLRLPALFTAWSNILAAHLISTSGDPVWPILLLTLCSSSAFYLGGMVLNDCFDLDEDRRERPHRPLPSGAIPMRHAWILGWGLLLLGIAFAGIAGTMPLIIGLLLALCIIVYDSQFKQFTAGCLVIGCCRYLNWLLGFAVVPLAIEHYLLPLPILLYVASTTFLSRIETTADEPGAVTGAITGMAVTAMAIVALYSYGLLNNFWPLPLGLLLFTMIIIRLKGLYQDMQPAQIQQNVKMLLLGIIPLDALMASAATPWWSGLIILLLLLPGRLLVRIINIT